jgi:hypothetical protein
MAMYWFKSARGIILTGCIMLMACMPACRPDVRVSGGLKYFDLTGYFAKDAALLNKLNKPVLKTVTHNGVTETKTVHIADWGLELSLFTEADINKPAWKDSYKITNEDGIFIYRAKTPDLKVREILIKMDKQNVKWILIYNKTPKYILYQTTEKLSYFPDSLYMIERIQRVRLTGTNVYKVRGEIGK